MKNSQTGRNPLDLRSKYIRRAALIALIGNLALAGLKLVSGYIFKSLAVLGDGIDSSTDVAIACMTLIIGSIIARPSDEGHPWGHGRAETTGTMVLSFIIFFAGAQLAMSSIQGLIANTQITAPESFTLIVTGLSIVGKIFLAWSQFSLGKKAASSIVLANGKNMLNDIFISFSVLAGLGAARIFSLPILDPIAALLVSIWIIKNAVKLFLEMNTELMDGNEDKLLYKQLFEAIRSVNGVSHPHRARIRKIASLWDIDLDIEVSGSLSLYDAHEKAEEVTAAIRKDIPDIYDIMVHVEPAGYHKQHHKEGFGLSEKDV